METILVPTDFSAAADNATDYAVQLAKYFNAKLILVNASAIPAVSSDSLIQLEMYASLQQTSIDGLENLKKKILKNDNGLNIECFSETGYAYDVIIAATLKYKANLVVMGIIGEAGRIKEKIIGSTSVKIAKNTVTPVFIIPESVKYHRIHKISFACDLKKTENSSIIYIAKYFAKVFDSELEVVNVEYPNEEITIENAKSNLFVEKKLQNTNHKSVFITDNQVAKGLLEYFKLNPTDVVMLNPKKHSVFHNLFYESVTKELAFHLQVPILTAMD
ncbi:MAG TPA: universal stress protein [Bacteroidia bacterium]|jgi:nucleotide-binding universal stress UspA family protein|nr:universal stress protein [Bacteroidia bacterium]